MKDSLRRLQVCPRCFGRRLGRLRSPPLPQALHLARLELVQVLFLHVQAAQSGAESIVGNVLLLLGLSETEADNDHGSALRSGREAGDDVCLLILIYSVRSLFSNLTHKHLYEARDPESHTHSFY